MSPGPAQLRGAIAARDAAVNRVRTTTAVVAAGCVALGAAFAALASASTHPHRTPASRPPRSSHRARGPVVAPTPPLVAVSQTAGVPAQPPAAAPSAAPPATPPVAVSGGS
jgi:type IV secretory pathway VirB10-like protein